MTLTTANTNGKLIFRILAVKLKPLEFHYVDSNFGFHNGRRKSANNERKEKIIHPLAIGGGGGGGRRV